MFQKLVKEATHNIETIRLILKTNDQLKRILSQKNVSELTTLKEENENTPNWNIYEELIKLKKQTPKYNDWELYEHCSVVTRLYAIYETFVEKLIKDWIEYLPNIYKNYSDLDQKIRDTHQEGISKLLRELLNENSRFKELTSLETISQSFYSCIRGEIYSLIPEAFILQEQNLRSGQLESLFNKAGISSGISFWTWIKQYRTFRELLGNNQNADSVIRDKLDQFIEYRNDASHQDSIIAQLGYTELLELCHFIESLCQSLAELAWFAVTQKQIEIGELKKIGFIDNWFPKKQVIIANIYQINLKIEDTILLMSESKAYCKYATIENIRIDDTDGNTIDTEEVEAIEEFQIAVKINTEVCKGLDIYVEAQDNEGES